MTNLLEAMHSRPDGSDGRESRTLYVVRDDYTVGEYTGWSCAPTNPDMWWCPEYGYSVAIGHGAYETRQEALTEAKRKLEAKISDLQALLRTYA